MRHDRDIFKKTGAALALGVTGGVASGKSTVCAMLEEMGAPLVDMDVAARRVVEPGTEAFESIVALFGKGVLTPGGVLDRKKIGAIVFADPEKRKKLESLTHPAILRESAVWAGRLARKHPGAVIQMAVPLLIESGMMDMFDNILLVHIPPRMQARRLAERDQITLEEAGRVLKSQLPINEKIAHADFVIDNRGTVEETRKQVEGFWKTLKKNILKERSETL
ncbi:Dephospho-CoA kinase [Candidatus Desulfarcum epimagneticum]|uniref:Dephospho-CoA kinase n=1 Tax=uncultured Desulfobacteraceae bacterium TaxID=218296 RepID=A0A484HEZ6_9BACT|nr:Dephospho-CoA kinase [uncultured Desulfobacteraceae bacterium]